MGSTVDEKPVPETGNPEPPVRYSMSPGFVRFLDRWNIAIAATSYQSGRLYLLSRNPKGGLMVNEQLFENAMGLWVEADTVHLASRANIHRLQNVLRPGEWINETYTQCYVPRMAHFTGLLDIHDIGVGKSGDIVFVSSLYNCIATLSDRHSFKEVWRPAFVSSLVAEDRCHLNGMAMENGAPRYATAVSRSDVIDGWRDRRSDGGVVVDVPENRIVCDGLSMPHSPRLHNGRLWVLNSGAGELGWVEPGRGKKPGKFNKLAFCPGFLRGLSFHGNYAFVGLSRPRYQRFEGLALDDRLRSADAEAWCGIQIIDLATGACVEWFRIDGAIGEMYDVAVLENVGCAQSLGFTTDEPLRLITIEKD